MSIRAAVSGGAALTILAVAAVAWAAVGGDDGGTRVAAGGAFEAEAWRAVLTFSGLAALLTLTGLEVVLGIDNIVFITVLTARVPEASRPRTRRLGLLAAMISRIALLLVVGWLIQLTTVLFEIPNTEVRLSGKDLILLAGGTFLLYKAVREIHAKVQVTEGVDESIAGPPASVSGVLVQIMLVDLVFSLDSVITAVGMTTNIPVMILAVVISVLVMVAAAGAIGDFVERYPAVKILALSFLVLVAVLLMAEGLGQHIDKGYIYFAMAFALVVELLQIRMASRTKKGQAA